MNVRKPIQRAFTGLVGMPPEQSATLAPVPAPSVPAKRGPGRPPNGDKAMTPTERKRASRANNTAKVADAQRRDLIAKLLETYKRMLPENDTRSNYLVSNRQRMRTLHNELFALTLKQLELVLSQFNGTLDSTGRLKNERSGEDNRKYGMSEMERIVAAQERDEATTKVSAGGASPDSDEDDSPDSGGRSSGFERMSPEYREKLRGRERMFEEMVQQHCDFGTTGLFARCRLCGVGDLQRSDLVEHFATEYERGMKLYEHWKTLSESELNCPQGMVDDAKSAWQHRRHLTAVWNHERTNHSDKVRAGKQGIS